MWIDVALIVRDQPFEVSVERLPREDRDRLAAVMAWYALQTADGSEPLAADDWRHFMEGVVFPHIKFTIPEPQLAGLATDWWNEASGRAIVELVRANELTPALTRHLRAIGQSATGSVA